MKLNQSMIQKCKDEELRKVLLKLEQLNDYYSLLEGDIVSYTKAFDVVGKMPVQLKEWLKIFDGGHLFFISMLTTQDHIDGLDYPTFQEVNSNQYKMQNNIATEAACFAIASDGDLYCFDSEEGSEKIYEWDCREGKAVDEWEDFAAWLSDRINFARSEIEEGILTPMKD